MAEINPAGYVLRGVIEDSGQIGRQRGEHLLQVIDPVLEVETVRIERDRPRGVPRQGGDEFGMRRAEEACGWFRVISARIAVVTYSAWAGTNSGDVRSLSTHDPQESTRIHKISTRSVKCGKFPADRLVRPYKSR
jgi:hypothetical protein